MRSKKDLAGPTLLESPVTTYRGLSLITEVLS
jgi:hypothetical protein